MPDATVSVVLPVHAGVDPAHLEVALNSVVGQTRPPEELVVVRDGPLSEDHDRVIDAVKRRDLDVVVVHLPVNRGPGVANQAGLEAARGRWICKADADDVNVPERIERQLLAVGASGADLCGAAMGEFEDRPDRVCGVRPAPLDDESIRRRLVWNNPVNHPTAFFRRELALAAGGYPPVRLMEDYALMARMCAAGARMMNLPDVLVLFRADPDMYRRRAARANHLLEARMQRELVRTGHVGVPRAVVNLVLRTGFRLLPSGLLTRVHRRLFRRPAPAPAVTG